MTIYNSIVSCMSLEPYETYRAKSKHYLGSHALADYRWCPAYFKKKHIDGLIPDKDSQAYAEGRAAHKYILEGADAFHSEYIVGGPINEKTGKPYGKDTAKFADWVAEQGGKEAISDDDMARIIMMCQSVRSHEASRYLIANGTAEGVLRGEYVTAKHSAKAQIRIDWLAAVGVLVDFKTCRNLDDFEADAAKYGYVHQMAYYTKMVRLVTGEDIPAFLLAAEKQEPYRTGLWALSLKALERASEDNDAAFDALQEGKWPTHYEHVRLMTGGF